MVTVGVDLHKRVAQIAVLTPEGEVSQHRLETTPREITQFFAKLPAQTPVAVEASATWWWFIDLLEAQGHRPVLSHPKQTKAIVACGLDPAGVASRGPGVSAPSYPLDAVANLLKKHAAKHAGAAKSSPCGGNEMDERPWLTGISRPLVACCPDDHP